MWMSCSFTLRTAIHLLSMSVSGDVRSYALPNKRDKRLNEQAASLMRKLRFMIDEQQHIVHDSNENEKDHRLPRRGPFRHAWKGGDLIAVQRMHHSYRHALDRHVVQDPMPVRFFANQREARASESAQVKGTGTCSRTCSRISRSNSSWDAPPVLAHPFVRRSAADRTRSPLPARLRVHNFILD